MKGLGKLISEKCPFISSIIYITVVYSSDKIQENITLKCITVDGKDDQSYRNLNQPAIAQILLMLILVMKGVNENSLYQRSAVMICSDDLILSSM